MGRCRMAALAAAATLSCAAWSLAAQDVPVVYRVPVTGVIELGLAPYIERSLTEARDSGASALILDLDTPGGRVDAAERIADAVADAGLPVYALVNRRAFSAGALVALATNGVFMRPGSVIGAATPVDGSGRKASEKILSAMRSEMRALAERRGLDPRIAEAMVDERVEIAGVVDNGTLLTLTTDEAVSLGYAAHVDDLEALLEVVGLAGADVVTTRVNWAERVVRFLSHPVVAPFLLTLGFLGLVAEIKTPTFGVAGAAGILSLAMFFGSHLLIGLAGIEEVLLFTGGLVFVALEVFVIPGFGLFGVVGGAAVAGGVYMSMLGGLPTMPDFTRAALVLTTTVLLVVVSVWAILRSLPGSRFGRSGLFLSGSTDRALGYESAPRRQELVGLEGRALNDLRPAGTGLFDDERVDVVSESEWIPAGTAIRIVSAEGYRHVVRALSESSASA